MSCGRSFGRDSVGKCTGTFARNKANTQVETDGLTRSQTKKKTNPMSMCNHAEAPSHVNKLSVSGGDELVSGH